MDTDVSGIISARAVLKFGDEFGKKASFSLPRARLDKTADQAKEAMQAILNTGALRIRSMDAPTTAKGVSLVKTIRTQIL